MRIPGLFIRFPNYYSVLFALPLQYIIFFFSNFEGSYRADNNQHTPAYPIYSIHNFSFLSVSLLGQYSSMYSSVQTQLVSLRHSVSQSFVIQFFC